MLTQVQSSDESEAPSSPAHSKDPRFVKGRDGVTRVRPGARMETMRAIHATWRKVARGIDVHDKDELRAARLQFAARELGLRKELTSFSRLSDAQLGRVLDAMRALEAAPSLPGVSSFGFGVSRSKQAELPNWPLESGEVVHLATEAQAGAVEKLFAYLRWRPESIEKFLVDKFKRKSTRMLSVSQANSCTMILLTIAARKKIARTYEQLNVECPPISRARIRAEIPGIKRELAIDQGRKDEGEHDE